MANSEVPAANITDEEVIELTDLLFDAHAEISERTETTMDDRTQIALELLKMLRTGAPWSIENITFD